MPKNQVSDPITDQEIAFARLILSGTMTDRQAAGAVGLNPAAAAYTKAKPRVYEYMVERQAALCQQLIEQEAEQQRQWNLERETILTRLWQLANLSPESTRNNISCQIKAMSMIVAIHGVIPDRRAAAPKRQPSPVQPEIYAAAAWRNEQQAKTPPAQTAEAAQASEMIDPPPGPPPAGEEHAPAAAQPGPELDPNFPADAAAPVSHLVPDTSAPFSIATEPLGPLPLKMGTD